MGILQALVESFVASLCLMIPNSIATNGRFINATNAECACPGELLTFECTVIGARSRATIWDGSAFTCVGEEISLRHENFFQPNGISKDCNPALVGGSVSVVNDTCFTSQLNVTVSAALNSTTVSCSLDSDSQPVGTTVLTVADACSSEVQTKVNLSEVRSGELTFSWSPLASNCQPVQYWITSDCGNCSNITTRTSTTCSNMEISATEKTCTFSVSGGLHGFTGRPSDPITVVLKVPDVPEINLLPVYSSDNNTLINVIVVFTQDLTDSFLISEGISGSIVNYTIYFSSDTSSTVPADVNSCRNNSCEYTLSVPTSVCSTSEFISMIRGVAANQLGLSQPSETIPIECINRFVVVNFDQTDSTLTCTFQNTTDQSSVERTCAVEFRVCDQEEKVFSDEGNSTLESDNKVILQIELPTGSNCYSYRATASDGTNTVVVDGRVNQETNGESTSSKIVIATVVPIVAIILILAVVAALLCVGIVKWHRSRVQRKPDFEGCDFSVVDEYIVKEDSVQDSANETNINGDDAITSTKCEV